MRRTFVVIIAAVTLALASSATPRAEQRAPTEAEAADLDVLAQTIRANRKALVSVNLGLTEEQAARFWPLYDRYQKDVGAVGDRVVALVEDYQAHFRDLSDDKAMQLIRGYLDADAERAKVRLSYLDEFAKILPGRTVARFYQIENKMDAVLRYDLAATIPVVEEGGPPAK